MTITTTHSPTPWTYEYNPYTVQSGDAATEELPAFEIFDAEQNKIFDTNEDMPCEIQEANARLASAAPVLLVALQRAEFLMRRVSDGDHRALENLRSAADQAQAAIDEAIAEADAERREPQ
jgi:hypothetical protein